MLDLAKRMTKVKKMLRFLTRFLHDCGLLATLRCERMCRLGTLFCCAFLSSVAWFACLCETRDGSVLRVVAQSKA